MEVNARREADGVVIEVSGDVDLYSSPRLRKAIVDSVNKRLSPVVVNLSEVTYIDSSGVATLVEGLQLTSKYHGRFRLVGLNQRLAEVFKLARLQNIFEIFESETEALGS